MSLRTFPQGLTLPLDATSIADGSVNDSEFQYLNGATSNIQAQLDALSGATPLTSYLASTVTYNNTAALANTALSVTVAAATKYAVTLYVPSTNVAVGLKMDFAGTATFTNFVGEWFVYPDAFPGGGLHVTAPGTDFDAAVADATGFPYYTFIGSCLTDVGGTFLLRGAQNAADASNTTILAGSTLILTPMS